MCKTSAVPLQVVRELEGLGQICSAGLLCWLENDDWNPEPPEASGDDVEEIVQMVVLQ